MVNKRLGKRRRGQVKARPIQGAIDRQAQIDRKERTNQRQRLCRQKKQATKKIANNFRRRLDALDITQDA
jgi:hypothetical protein